MCTDTMKQVYLLAQKHCGLKIGDWVRVIRYANWNEWHGSWLNAMNDMIENVYRIDDINQYGIILEKDVDDCYAFPYFVLEKVENPAHEFNPYEQVLVRDKDDDRWRPDIFLYIPEICSELFACSRGAWQQCIPYKGNEHLAGTRKKPEE